MIEWYSTYWVEIQMTIQSQPAIIAVALDEASTVFDSGTM